MKNSTQSVSVMEFDSTTRLFKLLRQVDLASVPTMGDLLELEIDGVGYVYEVYSSNYGDGGKVDVNVIRLSNITDYKSSGYPDITE